MNPQRLGDCGCVVDRSLTLQCLASLCSDSAGIRWRGRVLTLEVRMPLDLLMYLILAILTLLSIAYIAALERI